jgi:hypothetical protein
MEYWEGTPGYSRGAARVIGVRGCCGTGRRAYACRAAGAFVSGAAGSNACPAGSVRIETEAACRTAVTAAGKTFSSVETHSSYPRGCYYITTSTTAWLNTHAVGAGQSGSQPLCAALATAGAPLKRRGRTDARCACSGARACRHRACFVRPSWAACVIHGRHIDAHTCINWHLYIYIYPYGAVGARRRCRAAHGSARRTGGHGHVRVLKKGYSKRVLNGAEKLLRAAVFAGYWQCTAVWGTRA